MATVARRPVAPVLTKMVGCGSGWSLGSEQDNIARRELAALKRAARLLDRVWYTLPKDHALLPKVTRLLARLDRAGGAR